VRACRVIIDVRITDEVDDAATAQLRERVTSFNLAATGLPNGRLLACFLRDADGHLIAGLDGFSWGGYAKIEWLWVRDDHRRHGLATQLMRAAEDEAVERGLAWCE
jgi:GNAT superfamily N-acetyltransferase